jgi:hypothetical protein
MIAIGILAVCTLAVFGADTIQKRRAFVSRERER